MKSLIFVVCLFIATGICAQEAENKYTMYQSIILTPNAGHGQQLRTAMKTHNQKYHTTGVQTANVWGITSGPRTGSMLWIKGPLTFSDMDNPIAGDAHMDDWRTNIASHAKTEAMEFWRLKDNLNYMPENFVPKVMVVRYFNLLPGKGDNAEHVFGTLVKMYKEKGYDMGLQVYNNQANAGDGRDWAIIWYHDSWASMDKQRKGWDSYEEMYGMDSRDFFDNWRAAAEYTGMEIMTLQAGLSAATGFKAN
jgi:hypothetical protein